MLYTLKQWSHISGTQGKLHSRTEIYLFTSGGERNSIPNRRKDFPVTGIDLQKPIIDFRQKKSVFKFRNS